MLQYLDIFQNCLICQSMYWKKCRNLQDWIDTLICKLDYMPSSLLGFITTDLISLQISQVAQGWQRKRSSLNPDWLNRHNIITNPSLIKASLVLLRSTGGLILPTWSHACQQLSSDAIKDLTIQHPKFFESYVYWC